MGEGYGDLSVWIQTRLAKGFRCMLSPWTISGTQDDNERSGEEIATHVPSFLSLTQWPWWYPDFEILHRELSADPRSPGQQWAGSLYQLMVAREI